MPLAHVGAGLPLVAAVVLAAAGPACPFQDGKLAAPVFQVYTTNGKTLTGTVESLDPSGRLQLTEAKAVALDARQWLTLRRDKLALPPYPATAQVVFANGDRVPLAEKPDLKMTGNRLQFRPRLPVKLKAGTADPPLATVSVIWLGGSTGGNEGAGLLRQLQTTQHKTDVAILRSGDRVEGTITALDKEQGCHIKSGKQIAEVPLTDVAAIAFNSALTVRADPEGMYWHVVLTDGTRLGVTSVRLQGGLGTLHAKTLFGTEVEVPLDETVAVEVRNGAATYLSDLKPVRYEHKPFVGGDWPLVNDGSVSGHELRLESSTFDKGLGMHSEGHVSYSLAGKYRWFEARVGLDPERGKKGRVRIRVLLDGKEADLGWNKELTGKDEPLVLRIDLKQAKELTLEVLFGSYGDVEGHVNWADARLVE